MVAMVEFSCALTLSALQYCTTVLLYYRSQIENHSLDKNRTMISHGFRTNNSKYARFPLDHSGDEEGIQM